MHERILEKLLANIEVTLSESEKILKNSKENSADI